MSHLQNHKYQPAEEAPTRGPYTGFISEEPGRRSWQGHVQQRSRAVYAAEVSADERRPDPSAREVGQTCALEAAEPEQHDCGDVARFQDGRLPSINSPRHGLDVEGAPEDSIVRVRSRAEELTTV